MAGYNASDGNGRSPARFNVAYAAKAEGLRNNSLQSKTSPVYNQPNVGDRCVYVGIPPEERSRKSTW